ncbi:unnamed protein product [Linum trigynum]|uniref:Uncharacterized protein n=1 Tax=Linum trigynum TaxID=586398 RepID=A0AAV2CQP9_9ROSI
MGRQPLYNGGHVACDRATLKRDNTEAQERMARSMMQRPLKETIFRLEAGGPACCGRRSYGKKRPMSSRIYGL